MQSTQKKIKMSYDRLPYDGRVYAHTQPDFLYKKLATLDFTAPPHNTANVLELGCGEGDNAAFYAYCNPDAMVMGVDISDKHIDTANALKENLKLSNLAFIGADIHHMPRIDAKFDYIIAHGLYSWVPTQTRQQILKICAENLSDNGVALISFNAYPGWHDLMPLRNKLAEDLGDIKSTAEKIKQAREILKNIVTGEITGCSAAIKEESRQLLQHHDSYIYHDYLALENTPFGKNQFIKDIAPFGLTYICESTDKESPRFCNAIISRRTQKQKKAAPETETRDLNTFFDTPQTPISPSPESFGFAKAQILTLPERLSLTNKTGSTIQAPLLLKLLVYYCDGVRTIEQLCEEILPRFVDGTLSLRTGEDMSPIPQERIKEKVRIAVQETLELINTAQLLI